MELMLETERGSRNLGGTAKKYAPWFAIETLCARLESICEMGGLGQYFVPDQVIQRARSRNQSRRRRRSRRFHLFYYSQSRIVMSIKGVA